MHELGSFFGNIGIGLEEALSLSNLMYCFFGVLLGMVIGVLPGIGSLATISMLVPLTFYLDPTSALIMLAGIYYGGAYGGKTTSILLNVPGEPSTTVICLDGYPMTKQGRAGAALFMTTISSFVGASIGILLMMVFSPVIVEVALSFGSAEYFALMILGLIAASAVSQGSVIKGIAMVVLGIAFGCVGTDVYTGIQRFDFGILELYNGFDLVVLAMGVFGITEVITSVRDVPVGGVQKISMRSMVPTRDDLKRFPLSALRGTAIGSLFGTLPGAGGMLASFVSYALEKRIAKNPSRFGRGAIEGIIGPDAANNAADQTAFIPTMTLGVPSTPTMALMLGVLMIHGIVPGPRLMVDKPDMFWGLVMSFWVGNLLLLILNIPLIGLWVKLLTIPYRFIYPSIIMFTCIGAYTVNNSAFAVVGILFFGALGYLLRLLEFPPAPMLLGFVLGPLIEEHFRRAMLLSGGNLMTFFERPISGSIMVVAVLLLLWGLWGTMRGSKRLEVAMPTES